MHCEERWLGGGGVGGLAAERDKQRTSDLPTAGTRTQRLPSIWGSASGSTSDTVR